jgi:RimJ/RimL family protein N-acetyltransferase
LVPLDKARHMENALAWVNDPDVTETTLMGDFPLARLAEEAWFDRVCGVMSQTPEDVVFAVETLAGEHIGTAGIHRIDWRHGTALTGTIIGAPEARGRGYGTDAARVRTRYAFEVLGLRLLLSEVMAENAASLRMLQRVGYREVGRIPRRFWKRGAFREVVLLACEREGG